MSEVTAIEHLIASQRRWSPHATGQFTSLMHDLILSAKIISRNVNQAGLVDILGATGAVNVQGEQVQKRPWLLKEGVGEQTAIAVHEQRLRKARAAVDGVEYEDEVGQEGEQQFVDPGLGLREEVERKQYEQQHSRAHQRDAAGALPEYAAVAAHEQIV